MVNDWVEEDLERILAAEEIVFQTEMHPEFKCYLSHKPEPNKLVVEKTRNYFRENHFVVGWNMFDPEWDNDIQAEQIFKKLIAIYDFSPSDENILFVRGPKFIWFEDYRFVEIPPGGVFVYDKTKVKVDYEESE